MGGLFSKPKSVKPPPVQPPPAIPEVDESVADVAAQRARRRSGFRKTIITGSLTPEGSGKKTTLG